MLLSLRLQHAAYTQRQRAAYALFRFSGPTREFRQLQLSSGNCEAHLLDVIGALYVCFFLTIFLLFTFSSIQVIYVIIVASSFV